jgi:hypothetical protein
MNDHDAQPAATYVVRRRNNRKLLQVGGSTADLQTNSRQP